MKYGLIGEHLPHSFSKEIHAKIANYVYELHEIEKEELDDFMKKKDFTAINVTIPYKKDVIPYLSEIDENAKKIGAVNTIVNRNGKLYGYNTDFFGMRALIQRLGFDFSEKKVVILGTGGTSNTAIAVAESLGAKKIVVVGRTAKNGVITYADLYRLHTDADFIINTTPCGMFPYPDGNEKIAGTPIQIDSFPNLKGVADAVYNPLRPNLIMDAKERNIPAEGGLYMLVAQAIAASEKFLNESFESKLTDRIFHDICTSKENIVLSGMPGSGKSTVGKILASLLNRKFVDTDEEIIRKAGKEISEIFAECGETGFRLLEAEVIARVSSEHQGAVIATGGGSILRDDNVRALKRNGRIYFLNRPLENILPTADRPLSLDRTALKERFEERYERYLSTCDKEIKTVESPEQTANLIMEDFFQ
ncbi:MAG: shikimate dehydrogenase [Ruminococcaceae bacterium]|nr:shikimate dehydrogenase [Oscillospiraceae bacterium]